MQRLLCLLLVGAFAAKATAQSILVTPNGYASTVGNTANFFPWNRGTASMRIQFLIDTTHFTNQGITGPIAITNLHYRPQGSWVSTWAGGSWPRVRIDMATSPRDWAAASPMFADNLGPDLTTVLNGPVFVKSGSTLGAAVVVPWHIHIPLTTDFIYDPMAGDDLTIDIHLDGTGWTGGATLADHVVGATALGSRVFNNGLTATGGTVATSYVPVTGFSYRAVSAAREAPYGAGCITVGDVSSYEFFGTSAAFDLQNTTITFLRTGTGHTAIPGSTTYVAPSGTAMVLGLTDNSETTVMLPASMPVGASGSTNQLTVCSNGFISNGTGNGFSFTPTANEFLDGPRTWWSLAWHDFNPSLPGGGRVKFEVVGGIAYVTWDGVSDSGFSSTPTASTFQAQFELSSGTVHYVYRTMSSLGNGILTGFSDAGPSTNPGSMDISAALPGSYTAAVFRIRPLAHDASTRPVIGSSISLATTNVPPAGVIGLTLLGLTEFTTGIDLTALGMPQCRLHASPDALATFLPTGGTGSTLLTIPPDNSLAGAVVLSQSAVFVPGINTLGFITSNGVRLTLDRL